MTDVPVDTSVAIPLLVETHDAHRAVTRWLGSRRPALCGHALTETYAVLTRLPGDIRVSPDDAAVLLADRFGAPLLVSAKTARRLPSVLADLDIAGGATYDALVAFAAREHGATLATRDARARNTYERLGIHVEIAA